MTIALNPWVELFYISTQRNGTDVATYGNVWISVCDTRGDCQTFTMTLDGPPGIQTPFGVLAYSNVGGIASVEINSEVTGLGTIYIGDVNVRI
jgi:hypothetical protein